MIVQITSNGIVHNIDVIVADNHLLDMHFGFVQNKKLIQVFHIMDTIMIVMDWTEAIVADQTKIRKHI